VTCDGDNTLNVIAGNGDGTFQARKFYVSGAVSMYQVVLADVNAD
jgi:hypothetical protein